MVEWTDEERALITKVMSTINYEVVGPQALARCLVVYPWTQRYFGNFGNLYNAEAIQTNPLIAAHGIKILHGLDMALKNMDNIKESYAALSVLHSEKLHVDPDNFRLFSDVLSITVAMKLGAAFTLEMQGAWTKFLAVVVAGLSQQYH